MSRCMRKSALKAREKINKIIEWETCDETSEMFQKAAAALDEELGNEQLTTELSAVSATIEQKEAMVLPAGLALPRVDVERAVDDEEVEGLRHAHEIGRAS